MKIPSINRLFSFYHSTAPTHSYHQTYSTNFLNTLHICLIMSFLKTKQLQAVCPLHAPTILPRLLLFCTNHLVERGMHCSQGPNSHCSAGEKSRSSCKKASTQLWISLMQNFLLFLLKLSFG